ncbi:MAG TPA: tetraacyldisaccharide 4'-kinase [Vicinamibacterales bacterium]|nr:tetraacyldisaccharide 4'-kinase [Vicinamibacterales bacterium]
MSTDLRSHLGAPTRRRAWYGASPGQQRLRQPVVSVGNLTAGGRGKTPVVEHLARLLVDAGERPAILSRGYGRREAAPGAVVVSDGTTIRASVDEAGDEPLMLAQALPGVRVVVCDDRRTAGALAETHLGATVHLLDDGFQHLVLFRDVDLVLVAPEDLTDRRFPFGRLRESPRALADADAILKTPGVFPADAGKDAGGLWFSVTRTLEAPAAAGPVVAVAGIARPERFFDDLSRTGWTVVERIAFGDHHRYRARDVSRIADAVRRTGAVAVVTTAKDAVRLPARDAFPAPLVVARLTASVEPAAAFRAWLLGRLAEARS